MISRRAICIGGAATLLASPTLASTPFERGKSLENLVASTFEGIIPLSNTDWSFVQQNISGLVYGSCDLPDLIFDHVVEEFRNWGSIDSRHFRECGTCYRLLIECTRNVVHESHPKFPRPADGQGVIYNGVVYKAGDCVRLRDQLGRELDLYVYKDKDDGYLVVNRQGQTQPYDQIVR